MTPPSSLDEHLGYWLRRVSNHVSGAFAHALQTLEISVAEWVSLRLICDREQMTSSQLADTLAMTRGAISKVLDKLEAKDWIVRTRNPEDQRVQWLALTRRGERLLPRLAKIADANDQHFFGCLSKHEQVTLRRLLKKLTDAHRFGDVPVD